MVPGKFVAFKWPVELGGRTTYRDDEGYRKFSPAYYVQIFAHLGVTAVVRCCSLSPLRSLPTCCYNRRLLCAQRAGSLALGARRRCWPGAAARRADGGPGAAGAAQLASVRRGCV